MKILVWGFSASGKSFLIENLSKVFKDYKIVYTSNVLKQISENKKPSIKSTSKNDGWYEFSNLDDIRFKNKNIDILLDKFLLSLINSDNNYIFDSWTLPYLIKNRTDIIKIYLQTSKKIRIKRFALRDKISLKKAEELLNKKDNFNKKHYKKLYNIEIGSKKGFDIIINTDNLNIKQVFKEAKNKLKKFI
ncbi:MAG: cytidylate kinase family protein [Candidatus ainarchaeum sp.]|nr:cytidylate kinase family protein [Candidatus ainarchaeum sp.]MDD3975654.1 cytidylate kinase family protein [Candidatus ainarchaeum sp.]